MSHAKNRPLYGAAFLLLSALLFAFMGILIRIASNELSNEVIVFGRNFIGTLLFLPILIKHKGSLIRTQKIGLHSFRSLTGILAMYIFFYAIALSEAMIYTYSAPVFIPIIAYLWLKEIPSSYSLMAVVVGICGVYMVVKPSDAIFSGMAALGFLTAIFAALAFVSVRKLSATEPPIRIVFYFSIISCLISIVPLFWVDDFPSLYQCALLTAIGIIATISQLALSRAYQLAPASKIGPIAFSSILFGGLFSWLIWDETIDALSFAGIIMIFFACMLTLKPTVNK